MSKQRYDTHRDIIHPGMEFQFVTASDANDLQDPQGNERPCRALLVGSAGAARLVDAEGNDTGATNLVPLQQGYNPISVRRIYATGLTASNIWALY